MVFCTDCGLLLAEPGVLNDRLFLSFPSKSTAEPAPVPRFLVGLTTSPASLNRLAACLTLDAVGWEVSAALSDHYGPLVELGALSYDGSWTASRSNTLEVTDTAVEAGVPLLIGRGKL